MRMSFCGSAMVEDDLFAIVEDHCEICGMTLHIQPDEDGESCPQSDAAERSDYCAIRLLLQRAFRTVEARK